MKITTKNSLLLLIFYGLVLLTLTFWPFNFFQRNLTTWEPDGGLRFEEPALAYTESAAKGLGRLEDFTFLLHFSAHIPDRPSWITSYGLDFNETNLLVGHYGDQLVVEIHRGGRRLIAGMKDVLVRGEPVWLAVVVRGGRMMVYLDGKPTNVIRGRLPQGSTWQTSYPLLVGCRADGKYPWDGTIYRIGFLDFPATEEEVASPNELLDNLAPIVDYNFRAGEGSVVFNKGSGETGPLVIPEQFIPYHRAVLMDIKELWAPRPIWSDIVMNVLVFIPLGLLIGMTLRNRVGPVMALLLAVGASLGLSLSIEALQAFLPRRWSTFADVTSNTLGGALGGLIWLIGFGRNKNQDGS